MLGGYRNDQGQRDLRLRDAVGLMNEEETKDWVDSGPKAVKEHLEAIVSCSETLDNYRSDFARFSGVAEGTAQSKGNGVHFETLALPSKWIK